MSKFVLQRLQIVSRACPRVLRCGEAGNTDRAPTLMVGVLLPRIVHPLFNAARVATHHDRAITRHTAKKQTCCHRGIGDPQSCLSADVGERQIQPAQQ